MGYRLNKSIFVSDLAKEFDLKAIGQDIEIIGVSSLSEARPGDLSFSNESIDVQDGVVVVMPSIETSLSKSASIETNSPRLDFIKLLDFLNTEIGFSTYERDSYVHETVTVGENVVIESGCHIGKGVIIEPNVVIHKGTVIGEGSLIRSCSSIGSNGFGFERLEDNTAIKFPHLGRVVIGKNVEIGSCTAIARGSLSDTKIEDGVKIDNLVHIAHNATIKKDAFIIACAEISGGVVVEEGAWVAPNSSTHQKIRIGAGSVVGLGAVVTKDVDKGSVWAGNPAKKLRDIS